MRVLAVDTALGACSVAILDGETIVAHRWTAMARGHAEALAPMVQEVLEGTDMTFAEFDRLAVTTGPGTFTGQRVGLAFMRGLRLALDRPLAGVTTLDAMAAAAAAEHPAELIAVVHDAKRGEAYGAVFDGKEPLLPVCLADFDRLMEDIARFAGADRGLVLAGTGAESAAHWLHARGRAAVVGAVRQPDARYVARLAAARPEPEMAARPLYLRLPDAKLSRNAIRLRPAVAADGDLLAGLNAASLPENWDAGFFAQVLDGPGGFGFVAEAHGVATGFVLARAAAAEAEILAIAVSAAYRRNGIARRLLVEAVAQAGRLGAANLFLEVADDNVPAQNLYESQGFRLVGRRKRYYPGGQDALLLRAAVLLEPCGLGESGKVE
jgi:tRNA threonylcarbamoyladenosine biosynthesis protein TsaB